MYLFGYYLLNVIRKFRIWWKIEIVFPDRVFKISSRHFCALWIFFQDAAYVCVRVFEGAGVSAWGSGSDTDFPSSQALFPTLNPDPGPSFLCLSFLLFHFIWYFLEGNQRRRRFPFFVLGGDSAATVRVWVRGERFAFLVSITMQAPLLLLPSVVALGFVHPNLCVCAATYFFLFFWVIVNIFLETGIVLLLLRSQVASTDRTHTHSQTERTPMR